VRPGPDDPPLAFGSIAAALEAAEAGATVQVAGGYYAERLIFTRPVRLESAAGEEVVIEHETVRAGAGGAVALRSSLPHRRSCRMKQR
jgi:hypothetical protein